MVKNGYCYIKVIFQLRWIIVMMMMVKSNFSSINSNCQIHKLVFEKTDYSLTHFAFSLLGNYIWGFANK